ncbi:NADPH dehydrogenase [Helicobacter cappadocius]|uniref:NADPH dehydrogenase n=1 Tax=Helicobacter cappadocius TaxID=3063998 RepID=A0AA90T9L3_9HELI|nr:MULTISPECIES: NADPH dehydrogenase [unclassified Helicobacter]MDO7253024.1 NADPH dehydrogenase [Helicobacter sp. faydin-H75]MDP2538987.1 NADPH dehydrogenase [Helicobacter sp. faydin-H76]
MSNTLFSNWKIKNLEIKNRVVMAPMDQYSATPDGKVTQWHYQHYLSRAIGQVGLIIVECSAISKDGRISDQDLGIWSDEHIEGLRSIAQASHQYGSKIIIQIGHSGRKCECSAGEIIAPSSIPFSEKSKIPREMNIEDIKTIIEDFKQAGIRALKAGFDGIEVHGAHGYLISEFLSPLANTRSDEYGKDRSRFLKEILEALRSVLPQDFLISLRISARDYHQNGNDIEDFVSLLKPIKHLFDVLNVSTGGVVEADIKVYWGYQIECARILREKLSMPCIGGGFIRDALMANKLITSDVVDGVFLARELLINPYWPIQAALELKQKIDLPSQYERGKYLYY